ncbi:Uncharacterized protein OBRU01_18554 [Operophtera brumata]|uniref:Uncharacterized protein n=1 Tax=Operophtera brumata TaxID=104452 RepID=A0A0L7KYY9_OPEBR|nr:Uncharacterized protein OBRU01_18554 [Operophtera brumata]
MKKQTEKRSNGFQSDDDKVRYKINKHHFTSTVKSPIRQKTTAIDDDNARYKFPPTSPKPKLESKPKPKSKIKVNFWSNKDKQSGKRLRNTEKQSNRRHTVNVTQATPLPTPEINKLKLKPTVRILKRVSFLPTPVFSDNHIPMVTVPDDLTIQLNEEEANDLHEDLNHAFVNSTNSANSEKSINSQLRNARNLHPQSSPNSNKRKRSHDSSDVRIDGNANELEFFSKYVVQKLRKMETNQRIYSENLINTVLMLGQLGKLNGKSKIGDA